MTKASDRETKFTYSGAITKLGLDKTKRVNEIQTELIPSWAYGEDFATLFLPYLVIIGDSREQDLWVKDMCEKYGIKYIRAVKERTHQLENLKEGDYTFQVVWGNRTYDYDGVVAYERKGSISEFYGNCTGYKKNKGKSDRARLVAEFNRFNLKLYKKVCLVLEFGTCVKDLIDMEFSYYGAGGEKITKNTHKVMYSAIQSWKQPNNKNFDVIQHYNRTTLFWLVLQDMYYFYRNELRNEILEKEMYAQ